VEIEFHSLKKAKILIDKGVKIPNPLSVDIGEEVDLDLISGDGVVIHPGCRIYGRKTVIAKDSKIGTEGPATIVDCRIGPSVELKAGFFYNSVFLKKSVAGYGSHIREGCIFEEEASTAHCCGLKQTILFPFVTLGSLINFCDCLIAGGTGRKDHTEVGSSYIHFNFTPHGDKATPSLFGDVPRGVMLREPPIFLGGQGGAVGPVRVGFGNVVAAGSIIRNDYTEERKLIIGKGHSGKVLEFRRYHYPDLKRIVLNNVIYLSNLKALKAWYTHIRKEFLKKEELGEKIYEGLLEVVEMALNERIMRLRQLADQTLGGRKEESELKEGIGKIEECFTGDVEEREDLKDLREDFKKGILSLLDKGVEYIEAIKSIPENLCAQGTEWLYGIVRYYLSKVQEYLPSFEILSKVKY
jgi:UDP-N-acetylglucosamine/UDP-N-acetylgalactosamine diphosphorylase